MVAQAGILPQPGGDGDRLPDRQAGGRAAQGERRLEDSTAKGDPGPERAYGQESDFLLLSGVSRSHRAVVLVRAGEWLAVRPSARSR